MSIIDTVSDVSVPLGQSPLTRRSSSLMSFESCMTYRPLSNEQIASGKSIINYFNGGEANRWAILMAQMQSGKTDTFLFIAAEMIRLGLVTNVVIFSGNADTMLKAQIVNIATEQVVAEKSFYIKYRIYLKHNMISDEECDRIIAHMLTAGIVRVQWGTELAKYQGPNKNTLFIWEESHYAQNKNQMPSKMLKRVGISANGDVEQLSSKGNYVVSVSATGFSEFSDNHHLNQGKWLELLQPGVGYNSVDDMKNGDRIVPYDNVVDGIRDALSKSKNKPMYGLIRATKTMERQIVPLLERRGWKVVFHDSLTESDEGTTVWNNMHNAPTRNTAIILKGMCRMGQNVEKAHLLFCFETAQNSKTDTVLQSFVGRACGYSAGSNKVLVYIPSKIYHSGELEKYIELSNGSMIIPSNARNILSNKQNNKAAANGLYPIIPIHIPSSEISIVAAMNAGIYTNYNSAEVLENVKALIQNPETEFKPTNTKITAKNKDRMEKLLKEIKESIETRQPIAPGSSYGVKPDGTEVNIWKMEDGSVYIYCIVPNSEKRAEMAETALIPKTTQREVFCHKLEDGSEEMMNGGFSLNLTPETAYSVLRMEEELSELIDLSLKTMLVSNSRSVNSVKDCDYRGISLNAEVLAGLQPDGEIYSRLKEKHGINLKITKMAGRQSKAHKDAGLVRIAKISW
jgi:hypothetical protein